MLRTVGPALVFGDQCGPGELDQLRMPVWHEIEDRAVQPLRDRFEFAELEVPLRPFAEAEVAGCYPVGEFAETSGRPARRASS